MLERVQLQTELDPVLSIIAEGEEDWPPKQEKDGIVIGCGFNFHNLVSRLEWDSLYMFKDDRDELPSYGVCDSVEQFIELFGEKLKNSEHKYAVGFTRVKRSDQPEEGGWRWHKWGEYFGKHKPQHEYLYNEEGIEEVWTFSILRKKTA